MEGNEWRGIDLNATFFPIGTPLARRLPACPLDSSTVGQINNKDLRCQFESPLEQSLLVWSIYRCHLPFIQCMMSSKYLNRTLQNKIIRNINDLDPRCSASLYCTIGDCGTYVYFLLGILPWSMVLIICVVNLLHLPHFPLLAWPTSRYICHPLLRVSTQTVSDSSSAWRVYVDGMEKKAYLNGSLDALQLHCFWFPDAIFLHVHKGASVSINSPCAFSFCMLRPQFR